MKRLGVIILTTTLLAFFCSQVIAQTTLFQDDFSDGDNIGWTTTVGDWSVVSQQNEVKGTTSMLGTQMAYTYAGDSTWTEYTLYVDITFGTADTEFYVGVRVDPTSFPTPGGGRQYYLSVDGDNDLVRLRYTEADPDDFVTILEVPYTFLEQTTYQVQINIIGNTIEASIDGDFLFTHTFSGSEPIYESGLVGIGYKSDEGPDGAFFDNVLVTTDLEFPAVSGCIKLQGAPLIDVEVTLKQKGGPNLTTMTNSSGCYEFEDATVGKKIKLEVEGP